MKAWNTTAANKWAEDNDMPYEGDKSKNATSLGYVRKISSWKNLFWDSLIKSKENSWASVFFSSWLDEPKPTALKKQRAKVIDDFSKMKKTIDSWVCHYTGMTKDDLEKASKGKFPLIFNGFLPQNKAKNPKDNGNPMEKGLVDKDGNEWTRLDK